MDCKMDTGGLVIKLHISRIDHYHWALRLREDWKSFLLTGKKQTNKQKKSNSQPKWCKHRTIHTSLNLNPWGSSERTERERERAPAEKMPCGVLCWTEWWKLTTYQPQFEQFGDDPVEHSPVVFLVDLIRNLLNNGISRQRGAVDLAEAFWVVWKERTLVLSFGSFLETLF